MLREAGIQINEVPKIHVTSPTEEHHAIIFQETNFRIPLTLHGTSSWTVENWGQCWLVWR